MAPAGSVGAASVPSACQMVLSSEYASTEPAGSAFAYVRSMGHGKVVATPLMPTTTPVPFSAGARSPGTSVTVEPSGTAPGCHVTCARPSVVTTAPACPAAAASVPGTAAGTGAGATRPVGAVAAACEPPALVAVTTSDTVAPMSPGVSVYVDCVAPVIAAQDAPLGSQRRHWYTNAVGDPVHVPTDELSCCPATVVPAMLGSVVATGLVAVPLPLDPTATVGAEAVAAPPEALCAVTVTMSACPVSAVVGLYVSAVAPEIGVQLEPAASHCCH